MGVLSLRPGSIQRLLRRKHKMADVLFAQRERALPIHFFFFFFLVGAVVIASIWMDGWMDGVQHNEMGTSRCG